ncbi:MAG: hypothetical protein H6740_01805 [Alphaproteobacteria bacterium]|nr:hypothetical protein [Alphaproteobacteria bacterium]
MRRPFALALTALALLTACFDCEEILTEVTWSPEAERFAVTRAYRNVDLECADAAACTEAVKAVLSQAEGSPFEDPEDALGEGAVLEDVHLERRGDMLDVVVRYNMAEVSGAASQASLFVEQEERALRTREHLVVMPVFSPNVELLEPARAKSRTLLVADDDGEMVPWTAWSLPSRARSVRYLEQKEDGIAPMLSRVPGLEAALVAEGMLGG